MAAILGLLGTEQFDAERFKNIRREVFYQYPNGAAPLTGILSLLDEEDTNDPEFKWYEKRFPTQTTLTVTQGSSKGPFLTGAGADAGDPLTTVVDTEYRVCVADATRFRVGHVIRILVTAGSATLELMGTVTAISTTAVQYLKFRALNVVAAIDNGTTNESVGLVVWAVGSSFAQGAVGSSGDIYDLPVSLTNYAQIFRTQFSMTGTAIRTGAKFDETGVYKDKAKDHLLTHSIEMEKAFLFGERSKYTDSTTQLPQYTTGGILWHLKQWELTSNNPYGAAGATANSDDNKRIININGALSEANFDLYLERAFRFTNNVSNEKLALCGSGFLSVVNTLFKDKSLLQAKMGGAGQTYGMDVVSHLTPFGTIHYKTHPLFSQNAEWRYNCLILDVKNLKYRYMQGRDTELLKNRQPNDADYRKDEWLGECGLECRFPESHMLLKGVTSASI